MKKSAIIVFAMMLATVPAQAATLYWDGGTVDAGDPGDGASAGGAGTWNTTIKNWDAGAGPHVAWINSNNDTAIFGGTAGTVTLGTNVQVGGLRFDTSGYTISGPYSLIFGATSDITNNIGSITFAGGSTITNFSGTVYIGYNNSGKSVTIENGGKWYGGTVYVGYGSSANAQNNSYNVGGAGAASTVSNGAIYVGWGTGISGPANYNTMTVSNATLQMGGALTIAHAGNGVNNNWVVVNSQGTIQLGNNSIVIVAAADYGYPAYGSNNGLVITNGGYVYAGSLSLNYNGNPGNLVVANGGTLITAGATIGGLGTIVGGGSGGPTSTWNLATSTLNVSGSGSLLTADGNGVDGGALVTNVSQLIVGPDNTSNGTMLMTNGAQVFATSVLVGNSTGGANNNNLLKIVGGAGVTSVLKAGGGSVIVGYMGGNGGIQNNQLFIGAGGILTNAGSMWVGYRPGGGQYNGFGGQQLVVTNGGQLFTTGNSGISYDNSGGSLSGDGPSTATIGGTNSVNGVRSLWDLGGGNLTVGFYGGSQYNINNRLMVTAGGILTNAGIITIGGGNTRTYQNSMIVSNASVSSTGLTIGNASSSNTVTVSDNSSWNLGGGSITNGIGAATGNVLMVSASVLTNVNALTVSSGAGASNNAVVLSPGGRIYATSAAIRTNDTLTVGIDEAFTPACGFLAVSGNLNISDATLNIVTNSKAKSQAYIIATYGTLTGSFGVTNGLPSGWKLISNYNSASAIALQPPPPPGLVITLR